LASEEDIILDFFSGSATTAHAVLELNSTDNGNRKFILVQLPEQLDKDSDASKAGYKTIADIGKERIRRVIKKIEKERTEKPDMFNNGKQDLGFKVFKLSPSNFKIWRGNEITEENLVEQLDAFTNPVREESKKDNMLFELILKAGYLLTDKIEVKEKFYAVNNGELIIALEEMNEKIIGNIISAQPKKVITLDNLFTDNDQLKANTVLQMKDTGIDFKTI
jgi:adenine-specific DNA-methyltransferase